MWPGWHLISIVVKIKYYSASFLPVATNLFFQKTYENECAVDVEATKSKFEAFWISDPL